MQTVVKVSFDERYGYTKRARLAKNNAVGRLGATLYEKSGQGFGVMLPLMGTAGVGISVGGGLLADGYLIAGALIVSILFIHLVIIGIVAYARFFSRPTDNAEIISDAREKYRLMDKEDRAVTKSLISNMERNVKQGNSSLAIERVNKFNEMAEVLKKSHEVVEDKSDIQAADNFLRGLRELETQHQRALTH